jgi:hypothetical protein
MTKILSSFAKLGLLAVALGAGACGSAVPQQPTWQADVRPLLVARCIRCHDGTARGEPGSGKLATGNFNYDTVEQIMAAPGASAILQTLVPMYVRMTGTNQMPPPPAAPLQDWEIEILDNWGKERPPM